MPLLFLLLAFVAAAAFVVSIINPRWGTPWRKEPRRWWAMRFYALALVAAVFGLAVTVPPVDRSQDAGRPPMTEEEKAAAAAAQAAVNKALADQRARQEVERKATVDAMGICQDYFKAVANHPSTVDFPMFDRYHSTSVSDAGVRVTMGPTAKNSFGLEIRFRVDCLVKDGRIVAFNASEAR